MARLIDADRLVEALPIVTEDKQISLYGAIADFMVMISEMPTVDAVEVVRCKDCARCFKHITKHNRQMMWICMRNEMNVCVRPDDFCSYGERRTDG